MRERKRVANNELDIINNEGNQRVDIYETLFPVFLVLVSFLIIYTSLTKLAILVPDFCGMNNKKKKKGKRKGKLFFANSNYILQDIFSRLYIGIYGDTFHCYTYCQNVFSTIGSLYAREHSAC